MSGKEEKQNIQKEIPKEKPKKLEDIIAVLEEKAKTIEKSDNFTLEVVLGQIQKLKKLKHKYDLLEDKLITKESKDKLQQLFQELGAKAEANTIIGQDLNKLNNEIDNEGYQREDTFIGKSGSKVIDFGKIGEGGFKQFYDNNVKLRNIIEPSMRDFVEKHIKFDGNFIDRNLNKIRETDFMTIFYDIFTIKYLDYIYTSKDKDVLDNLHKNLRDRSGIVVDEIVLNDLLRQTVNELLERGIKPENSKLNISLISGKNIPKDLKEITSIEVEKVEKHKIQIINDNLSKLVTKSSYDDFHKIVSLINELESYGKMNFLVKNIVIVSKLKIKLKDIAVNILKEKNKEIEEIINSAKELDEKGVNIKNINLKIESSKKIFFEIDKSIGDINNDEFDIITKEKVIRLKIELKKSELEKKEFENKLKSHIEEIKNIINTLKLDNIGVTLNIINHKKNELKQEIYKSNIIEKEEKDIYNIKILEIDDIITEKLLHIYLSSVGKETITDRGDIKKSNLFVTLSNAVNSKEITQKTMGEIVEEAYYLAFISELKTKKGEIILNKLERYGKVWKPIFREKLQKITRNKKTAEDFYMLPFIESSLNPDAVSEAGAEGFFGMLQSTAKEFGMKNPSDLKDIKKSAEIAAKCFEELLLESASEDKNKMISNALLKYNGKFSRRLNDEYNKDIKGTIVLISSDIDSIKSRLLSGEIDKDKALLEIENKVHNKYYKIEVAKGDYNFQILDDNTKKNNVTKQDIIDWIDLYTYTILNQQYVYPQQFKAVERAVKELM